MTRCSLVCRRPSTVLSTTCSNSSLASKRFHDFKPFRELFDDSEEDRKNVMRWKQLYPPAVHPVEGMHPVTGRKVLFVNPQFTVAIKNFTHEDSTAELYSKLISRSIFGFELAIDAILSRSSVERRTGGSIAQCIDKLCLVRGARGVGGRRCKATCDPRRL